MFEASATLCLVSHNYSGGGGNLLKALLTYKVLFGVV